MTTTTITGVHPLADLFPMLSKPELEALADDIKANGLREPIKMAADGTLVEGRNRLAACVLAGVEPRFETVNGDAGDLILSANIFRRHMTVGQIAILAVCAETGIELPVNESAPSSAAEPTAQRGINYDYAIRAHRRVEKLVSRKMVEEAGRIVKYAPDRARAVLDTGKDWKESLRIAGERSQEARSEENRTRIMQEDSPELLARVSDDGISLAEAWRIREDRIRQERDTRTRLTGYLVDRITPLLGKTGADELVEAYDPDIASRKIGIEDLDEAIEYLRAIRSEFKRQKKG